MEESTQTSDGNKKKQNLAKTTFSTEELKTVLSKKALSAKESKQIVDKQVYPPSSAGSMINNQLSNKNIKNKKDVEIANSVSISSESESSSSKGYVRDMAINISNKISKEREDFTEKQKQKGFIKQKQQNEKKECIQQQQQYATNIINIYSEGNIISMSGDVNPLKKQQKKEFDIIPNPQQKRKNLNILKFSSELSTGKKQPILRALPDNIFNGETNLVDRLSKNFSRGRLFYNKSGNNIPNIDILSKDFFTEEVKKQFQDIEINTRSIEFFEDINKRTFNLSFSLHSKKKKLIDDKARDDFNLLIKNKNPDINSKLMEKTFTGMESLKDFDLTEKEVYEKYKILYQASIGEGINSITTELENSQENKKLIREENILLKPQLTFFFQ